MKDRLQESSNPMEADVTRKKSRKRQRRRMIFRAKRNNVRGSYLLEITIAFLY